MSGALRKRPTLVVIAIVIILLSVAIVTQLGGRSGSSVGTSTTSSNTGASSTQKISTSASTTSQSISMAIGINGVYNALLATPSLTLNYSITISQFETTGTKVTLSAVSTVPGVTLTLSPTEFTFSGTQEPVDLGITVAPTVNASTLPIKIIASWASGQTSSTLNFQLNKALIVILPTAQLKPPILNVSVGQTVTWLNLIPTSDEGDSKTNISFADGSAASPTLGFNDVWSHKFDKPGSYSYQSTSYGEGMYGLTASAVVVVA